MAFLYLLLLVGINYTAPISKFHCNFLLCAFICVWIAPNYFSSALLQPAFGCLKTSKLWSKVLLRFFVHSSSMGPKSLRSQIWFLNPLDLFFDGTGRNRTGRDGTSNCPYVPGERNFLLPVPFLQGQGQEQKSHYKYLLIWFNWKLFRENDQISCFKTSFSYFRTSFSALFRFVSQDKKGEAVKIWYPPVLRPVPDFDRLSKPVPSLVPLSRDNKGTSVLLSKTLLYTVS